MDHERQVTVPTGPQRRPPAHRSVPDEIDPAHSDRNASRCLRPQEAADHLGISRAKLYELMATNEIDSITIGRSRRFPLRALDDYVARRLSAANRPADLSQP
jgi:excisionase family DNA binding protein